MIPAFNSKKEAALFYASMNWKVLPLHSIRENKCTCGRKDAKKCKPGKHPRTQNGVHDATTDQAQISKWWTTWPEANIAIATGVDSNLFVVDVDAGKGGYASLEALEETFGALPGFICNTGGGGIHVYLKHFPEAVSGANIRPGIDTRSDGGYVIVPPSDHFSGQKYTWVEVPSSGNGLPECPDTWRNLMKHHKDTVGSDKSRKKVIEIMGQVIEHPSEEFIKGVVQALYSKLCRKARAIIEGKVQTDDRSRQVFELACLAIKKDITDTFLLACLLAASPAHTNKFETRKDRWEELYRVATRALEEKGINPLDSEAVDFVCMSELKRESNEFLIMPYIPKGEITIVEGKPGIGKSFFVQALIAALSGSPLVKVPFDTTVVCNKRIYILSTEDDPQKTVYGRLEDMGAVMSNIHISRIRGTRLGAVGMTHFEKVKDLLYEHKPDLILVDPLTLYASKSGNKQVNLDKATDVRVVLEEFKDVARELNCAFVVVRHTRKGKGQAIDSGSGSIDIGGTARSVIVVAKDPTSQIRTASSVKQNLGADPPSIQFEIWPDSETSFRWLALTDKVTADMLTEDSHVVTNLTQIERAKRLLKKLFEGQHSITAKEGNNIARLEGLNEKNMLDAREALGIESFRIPSGWAWKPKAPL